MNFRTTIVSILITLFFSYTLVEAKPEKRSIPESSQYYYLNYEIVGVEVKYQRHGVNVNIGLTPLFESEELEVFNVHRDEAVSIDYHHYLVDSKEKSIYAGAGYFVRGNLFGQKTNIREDLQREGTIVSQSQVTVPIYAIIGEKIAIGEHGFMDMHVRINEKISPSIFFGMRF